MENLANFLAAQPMLAMFLVIATGYAIGQINIKGFSLGVGAVLFPGLIVGVLSPKAQPPAFLGTMGMILFLYGIGVQYGKQFFAGLAGRTGLRYNMLAFIALVIGAVVTIFSMLIAKVPVELMTGIYAGATSTAAVMLAAVEVLGNNDPAISYSVAFPFGLLGTIVILYIMQLLVRPNFDHLAQKRIQMTEVEAAEEMRGTLVADLVATLPAGVHVMAIRTGSRNALPNQEHRIVAGDVFLLGAEHESALKEACERIGSHVPGKVVQDRSNLDYVRLFVSKNNVIGKTIASLKFPGQMEAMVAQVRRGDADILPTSDLTLEFGDRVGLLADRRHFDALRNFFGDSIRGTTEFSYVALGLGMVLGVIASIIPIPIPGLGTIKLGIAGGVLIVALILGKIGRTRSLSWTMPYSANVILRNFGISLFLAQIGMSSGERFFAMIQQEGVLFIGISLILLIPTFVVPLLIGHYLMKIPFDDLIGLTSGLAGNAAVVAYASKAVPSEQVEISYAMVYPGAIILKILVAQTLIAVWGT